MRPGGQGVGVAGPDRVSSGVCAELLSGENIAMLTSIAVRNSAAAAINPTVRGERAANARIDGRSRRPAVAARSRCAAVGCRSRRAPTGVRSR